jgi:hypothetical protein
MANTEKSKRDELLAEAERDPQAARQHLQAERDAGRMSDQDADQVARVIFREMWAT